MSLPTETDNRIGCSTLANTISWCFLPELPLPVELASFVYVGNPAVTDLRTPYASPKDSLAWIEASRKRPYIAVPPFWIDYELETDSDNEDEVDFVFQIEEEQECQDDRSRGSFVQVDHAFLLFGEVFTLGQIKRFSEEWELLASVFEEWGWPGAQYEAAKNEACRCKTIVAVLKPFFLYDVEVPEFIYDTFESLGGIPYSPTATHEEEIELGES